MPRFYPSCRRFWPLVSVVLPRYRKPSAKVTRFFTNFTRPGHKMIFLYKFYQIWSLLYLTRILLQWTLDGFEVLFLGQLTINVESGQENNGEAQIGIPEVRATRFSKKISLQILPNQVTKITKFGHSTLAPVLNSHSAQALSGPTSYRKGLRN